jgi:hypothetical protein
VLSLGTQAPITGARVTVLIPPHGKVRGITAGNGNAVFQLPHEFEGRFVVSADGFRGTYRYVTSQNPNPTRSLMVPLEPAPPEEIRTIRLTDGKTGTALSGVTLIFDDGFLSSWGTTDAQGVEGVPTGLFRLPFYVQAQFGGYHPLRGVISSLETPVEHAFVMVPETPMNLTCRTPEGFPVPGASVRFQPAGDGWEGEAVTVSTDTEGRAVFTGFPLSTGTRLVLSAQRAGFTPVSKTFTLEEFLQSNGVLSLQMAYSHVFQGSVRDFGQWATSPLTVEYYFPPASNPLFRPDSAQDLSRAVAVGPGGTFSINGPGPGAVRVRLRRGDEVLHIGDVPVQANTPFEIVITKPVAIEIQVRGMNQAPVPDAQVTFLRRDEGFSPVQMVRPTDAQGLLAFTGCEPGRYSGAVRAEGYVEHGFDFVLNQVNQTFVLPVQLQKIN